MVQRVLVAIDDSGPATAALEYALTRFSDAEITAFHVLDIVDTTAIQHQLLPEDCAHQRDAAERTAESVFTDARMAADAAGIELTTATAIGKPAHQILAYADENGIDTIIMGTHDRSGLDRLLLGSISDSVRQKSSIPVVTVSASDTASHSPARDHHAQMAGNMDTRAEAKPPPVFRWCPDCAVTLYTQLEFCPGCLDELVLAAGSR